MTEKYRLKFFSVLCELGGNEQKRFICLQWIWSKDLFNQVNAWSAINISGFFKGMFLPVAALFVSCEIRSPPLRYLHRTCTCNRSYIEQCLAPGALIFSFYSAYKVILIFEVLSGLILMVKCRVTERWVPNLTEHSVWKLCIELVLPISFLLWSFLHPMLAFHLYGLLRS